MAMLQRNTWTRLERLAFWMAAALAMTMALLPHPPHLFIDKWGDKPEHMLAFATLTLLGAFAWPKMPRWRLAERLSFLGAMIEVMQSMKWLHRDCDIRDWMADTLAVLIVLGVLWLLRLPRAAFDKD